MQHSTSFTGRILGDCCDTYVVRMISLDSVSILRFQSKLKKQKSLKLEIQPTILAVGPQHFCVALENRACYYSFADTLKKNLDSPCFTRNYQSHIDEIKLNNKYCAARCGDKLLIHLISTDILPEDFVQLPGTNSEKLTRITCFFLTNESVVYAGNDGLVRIYELKTKVDRPGIVISSLNITRMIPNSKRTVAFITDESNKGFIYEMAKDLVHDIPDLPTHFDGVLWDSDSSSQHIFLTYSLDSLYVNVFIYWHDVANGYKIYKAGNFKAFDKIGLTPFCLRDSFVYSQKSSGSLTSPKSISRSQMEDLDPNCGALSKFDRLLTLKRYSEAAKYCDDCNVPVFWEMLGQVALMNLDLEIAIEAYVKFGKVGIAFDIDSLEDNEDIELCFGHISAMLGKYKRAEQHYLRSSQPSAVVHLNTYLEQWDAAFEYAKLYSPDQISLISKEYAVAEETRGNYVHALNLYEEVLSHADSKNDELISECKAGLARNCIRSEQLKRGLDLIQGFTETKYIVSCAEALVSKMYYREAAELYEYLKDWDNVASLYIKQKDWKKFDASVLKITAPEIFNQYAHAKELDCGFTEGAFAFERIGDWPNACRLFLKANQPDEAIRIAKLSKSFDAVKSVCNYFLDRDDIGTALRFLVMSGHLGEAVSIALNCDRIDLYASTLLEFSPKTNPIRVSKEYRRSLELIATFCKDMKQGTRAARFYLLSGNPIAAFDVILETARAWDIPCEVDMLNVMVEVDKSLANEQVTKIFRDYYSGELDGNPKDPRLALKFALKSNNFEDAANLALLVSESEQEAGNYLPAHCTLMLIIMEMKYRGLRIPAQNMRALGILHIYMLSRIHNTYGSRETAARLLARLANNSAQFPTHMIQILTSTAIQCVKAGLKETAMKACYKLMTPENRPYIDPKYKRKFELMLRKFSKASWQDAPYDLSPCPFCRTMLPNFELHCETCDTLIPFCIASGRHVTIDDLTCCPDCKFPAIHSEFVKLLDEQEQFSICPMCDTFLRPEDLIFVASPHEFLMTFVPTENLAEISLDSDSEGSAI